MGEFSPPFFEPPSFFFFSYPPNIDSNIEIIFDFSDFHPPFHPPFQNPGSAPGMSRRMDGYWPRSFSGVWTSIASVLLDTETRQRTWPISSHLASPLIYLINHYIRQVSLRAGFVHNGAFQVSSFSTELLCGP